jgi:hypothetical protein
MEYLGIGLVAGGIAYGYKKWNERRPQDLEEEKL